MLIFCSTDIHYTMNKMGMGATLSFVPQGYLDITGSQRETVFLFDIHIKYNQTMKQTTNS